MKELRQHKIKKKKTKQALWPACSNDQHRASCPVLLTALGDHSHNDQPYTAKEGLTLSNDKVHRKALARYIGGEKKKSKQRKKPTKPKKTRNHNLCNYLVGRKDICLPHMYRNFLGCCLRGEVLFSTWSRFLMKMVIFLYQYFPAHSTFSLGMETPVYKMWTNLLLQFPMAH